MKTIIISLLTILVSLNCFSQASQINNSPIYYLPEKVGVFTNEPQSLFHIQGKSSTPWVNLRLDGGRTSHFGNTGLEIISPNKVGLLQISYYNDKSIGRNYFSQPIVSGSGFAQILSHGNIGIGTYGSYGVYFGCNNTNVMTLLPNGNVGIGTLVPESKFHVEGKIHTDDLLVKNNIVANDRITGKSLTVDRMNGVKRSVISLTTSDDLLVSTISRYSSNLYTHTGIHSKIELYDNRIILDGKSVGVGTNLSSNPKNFKFAVNGKIGATEIEVVSQITSDVVFEEDYNLKSLEEVEKYVKENKHLPEIPSAREFKKRGQNLAKTDDLLLRKIEELTLYMIEQNKKIKAINRKNIELQKKIEELENK